MESSPYLLVLQLIVQGKSRNYVAKFEARLNLVWGDMDSGKSSILNLIDYCLGGKNENLLYDEMLTSGRAAALEVDLNGVVYTFERDILSAENAIRVHAGTLEQRSGKYPMLMSASPDGKMPDGWVSDFILDCLGIPKIKVKESRSRDDASSDRLSFRDLMKLMYLKQTRVGSDALLDYQNPVVFVKNAEIQKFVFNIYDDRLADLRADLASQLSEVNELQKNEAAVKKFLSDVSISVDDLKEFNSGMDLVASKVDEIDNAIEALKSDFTLSTDVGLEISNSVNTLRVALDQVNDHIKLNDEKYDNFVKLSNTYRYDLDALSVSRLTRSTLSPSKVAHNSVICPLCTSRISIDSPVVEEADLDQLDKSLKNRDAGIMKLLAGLRNEQKKSMVERDRLTLSLKAALRNFDENNAAKISPLIAAIQALEVTRSAAQVELSHAERNVAISHRFEGIGKRLDAKKATISSIRRAIKTVEEGLVGLDEVILRLDQILQDLMAKSGLQKVFDTYFDKRFIAYFRNISYYSSSSGGVRTILSIATFAARLRYLLENPCNLPSFLMIDTPGQNIGRYRKLEDESEMSDPSLYENIFKQLISLMKFSQSKGRVVQIIVVDNDLPDCLIENDNFHLVKRFDKQGGDFDKGLISDA